MRHVLTFGLLPRLVCGSSHFKRDHLGSQLGYIFLQILDLGIKLLILELKLLPLPLNFIQLLLKIIDLKLVLAFLFTRPPPHDIVLLNYHTDIAFQSLDVPIPTLDLFG